MFTSPRRTHHDRQRTLRGASRLFSVLPLLLLSLGLAPRVSSAGNGITSVSYKVEPGCYSIGVRCFVIGDADTNAVCRLFYRLNGSSSPYDSGMVFIRRFGTTIHCGRMLHLTAATTVQFYLELTDPTSGVTTTTADTVSTRRLLLPATGGTTYYVSTSGNDSNNGLDTSHPVKSIAHGLSLLSSQTSGTLVLMGPGEWHEANILDFGAPTFDHRYAIVGDGFDPDSIIIDGSYAPASRNGYVDATHAVAWTSVGVDSIYKCYYPHGDSCSAVILNFGEWLHPKLNMYELMHDGMGESSGFWWQNDTLYVRRADGSDPSGTTLHAGYYDNLLQVRRRYWTLSGFTMRYAGGAGNGVPVLLGDWSQANAPSNCRISDVSFYGCAGRALYGTDHADSVVVDGCHVSGLTIGAMTYQASKSRIQENAGVIIITGLAWTVSHNTLVQAFDQINQWSTGGSDTTSACDYEIVYNTMSGCADDACELDAGFGINGLCGWNSSSGGNSMLSVAAVFIGPAFAIYNTGWGQTNEGIKLGLNSYGDVLFAHNTISTSAAVPAVWNAGGAAQRLHFRNNIFRAGTSHTAMIYNPVTGGGTPPDTTGLYRNDWNFDVFDSLASSGGQLWRWGSISYSLPTVRSSLGWEKNGILGSSGLTNPGSGDLSLTAGSSAINAAQRIPGINTPALGQTFFTGAIPDAGALEAADLTPPSTTSDLTIGGTGKTTVVLNWTAAGDDGTVGTAASYNVRRSTSTITSGNFSSATAVTSSAPNPAGTTECLVVTGLSASTTYYFALKTVDAASNASAMSNVVSVTTHGSGSEVDCGLGDRARPATSGDTDVPMSLTVVGSSLRGGAAHMRFGVPASMAGHHMNLSVYDVGGRRIATLANGNARLGLTELTWNLRSEAGDGVGAGIYFVDFRLGSERLVRRVVVLASE